LIPGVEQILKLKNKILRREACTTLMSTESNIVDKITHGKFSIIVSLFPIDLTAALATVETLDCDVYVLQARIQSCLKQ